MQRTRSRLRSGRGITVLNLLLLIIALVIAAIFLVRYLRTRPAVSSISSHESFDQLDLAGMIQIVRSNSMDLLRVGPHSSG